MSNIGLIKGDTTSLDDSSHPVTLPWHNSLKVSSPY